MKLSSRTHRANRPLELSTTGFIDIVFLLLIFFLVTSTFLLPERQVATNILMQENQSTQNVSDFEPAIVDVTAQDAGVIFQIGAFSTSDETRLAEFLNDFVNKQDGAYVRATNTVPFDATAKAISACRQSGFPTVTYVPRP